MHLKIFMAFLILCFSIGACNAENSADYIAYFQGGVSALAEGTNGTMALTIADVIPYYTMEVADRSILMPMEASSPYKLPLNVVLVLNGQDGEVVYLVKISVVILNHCTVVR